MTILITGATGCVGRRLVDRRPRESDRRLLLIVRSPEKAPEAVRADPRVSVHRTDLAEAEPALPDLAGVEAAVLVATAWGGPEAMRVIRDANLGLADRLIAAGCRRLLYFSTASVLGPDGALLDVARDHGTDYIRGKHALTEAMETRAGAAEVAGLFPTLVVGGTPEGPVPLSHFARLMHEVRPWVGLARFLTAEARLHLIHAEDIAAATCRLLLRGEPPEPGARRLVLGDPATGLDELVRADCAHVGLARRPVLPLRPGLAEALIRLFRIRLSPWDRHCMEHRDQSYPGAVSPADFGLAPHMPDFAAGLRQIGVPGRR